MWAAVTDILEEKRALVIALSLTGAKTETAMSIPLSKLNLNEGLTKLLDTLKGAFGKEAVDELFADYKKFEKLCRTNASIVDFIAEFEQANARFKKQKKLSYQKKY